MTRSTGNPLFHRFARKIVAVSVARQMHSSQLIAPAHRSFIRIVAGTSDTHRFFYRVTNTRSRNRHIFRKLIRDNSPREHLSLSPSFHRQVTKTNDPFDSPKHTRKNIRAILRHARHPAPRFYARFPLFCAWPLLPRKKKKRKKERKEKVKRRETMNKMRQGDRGEGTRIEFFARTSVVSARVETSSIIPTDTRLLF